MWKAPLRGFLLVLVVAGVAVLSLGLWARFTIYDQDQFVQLSDNLASDPAIQQVVIERTMSAIDREIAVRQANQALSPTVAISYQMFKPQIESGVTAALQSPQFQQVWDRAMRELHGPLTDLLKGNDTQHLHQSGNQIQINLFPIYEQAKAELESQGITLLDQLNLTPEDLSVTLLQADRLVKVQEYVRLFNRMLAIGIIVSVLAGIGYILMSSRKLRASAWLLLAIALGWVIQRLALQLGSQQLVDSLKDPNQRNAAGIFYDTLVGDLRTFELWALIAAIGAAVVIYLVDRFYMQQRVNQSDAAV